MIEIIALLAAVVFFFFLYHKYFIETEFNNLFHFIDSIDKSVTLSGEEKKKENEIIKGEISELKKELKIVSKELSEKLENITKKMVVYEENEIEKKEKEEVPLSEEYRIPIVDGMKVKFEGDDKTYPIKIE
jgi:hypothetical protein